MAHLLVDTHSHIQFPEFDADRETVIQRAWKEGVQTLVVVGTDVESSRKSLELTRPFDTFYSAVGIHPHEAASVKSIDWEAFTAFFQSPKVLAVGEIGLDYYKSSASAEDQKELFRCQLVLAREQNKPCLVHVREAFDDVLEMIQEVFAQGWKGIAHCFSGTLEEAQTFIDLGFYISFAANVTYPKAGALREVLKRLPLDRIVLETDSPFLPPQSRRGQRNEPACVAETYLYVAALLDVPLETLAEQIYKNASTALDFPPLLMGGGILSRE